MAFSFFLHFDILRYGMICADCRVSHFESNCTDKLSHFQDSPLASPASTCRFPMFSFRSLAQDLHHWGKDSLHSQPTWTAPQFGSLWGTGGKHFGYKVELQRNTWAANWVLHQVLVSTPQRGQKLAIVFFCSPDAQGAERYITGLICFEFGGRHGVLGIL